MGSELEHAAGDDAAGGGAAPAPVPDDDDDSATADGAGEEDSTRQGTARGEEIGVEVWTETTRLCITQGGPTQTLSIPGRRRRRD